MRDRSRSEVYSKNLISTYILTQWHNDVDASDTATSLVMAEVTVDEAMLSTHGERRQQHVNAGERCQELARAGDGDGDGDGDSDGVCNGDGDGDGNGLGVDDRDGGGYVASNGNNAGERWRQQ